MFRAILKSRHFSFDNYKEKGVVKISPLVPDDLGTRGDISRNSVDPRKVTDNANVIADKADTRVSFHFLKPRILF